MNRVNQSDSQAYLLPTPTKPKQYSLNPNAKPFIPGNTYFTPHTSKPILGRSLQITSPSCTTADRNKEANLLAIIKRHQTPNTQQEGTEKEIQPTFNDIDFDLLRLWVKMEKYEEATIFLLKIYLDHNCNYEQHRLGTLTPEDENQIKRRIDNIKEMIQLLQEKGINNINPGWHVQT